MSFFILCITLIFHLHTIYLPAGETSHKPTWEEQKAQVLEKENREITTASARITELYEMEPHEQWRDITERVLSNPDTPLEGKTAILAYKRRIVLFKYPSDGLWIKGFISYTPSHDGHPLLILYRWGNENFALMDPGMVLATHKNYTTVSSTLRGGVSQGKDEYGGADVDDMKNLLDYLPCLAKEIGMTWHPSNLFMLGPSRGGLEMFLTLRRFPEIQARVDKIVALSAALDLCELINARPYDMKPMFQRLFGMPQGVESYAWIAKRNPINTIPFLSKCLPILIIQGTADNRVGTRNARHMVQMLRNNGDNVTYWEVPCGNHGLTNVPHLMDDIAQWLEN